MIKLARNYGGCKDLKIKVANEGVGYFYSRYTTINASYDLYESYIETDSCWCGLNILLINIFMGVLPVLIGKTDFKIMTNDLPFLKKNICMNKLTKRITIQF